ncbi:MlaD family protein [Terracidiphilus gabretensis]|uniref:MlaD family protein n=1 Tax=Terracidiphilus gabretensis TaxID=1577687 RepID=UPI001E4080A0|nr:MlaD family protein [Terracidiphilus gabretensis]
MPSRKEVQWSQLKVGALVLAGAVILIFLIFLMSGSTGGLFAKKLTLRVYFENASGLKQGAPVTLEGVTIGNVTKIRVVPERNPTPVEVTMKVPGKLSTFLHTDSAATIASAGVLGDSYIDITSTNATGPPPANNAELVSHNVSGLQQVMNTSQDALQQVSKVLKKTSLLMDSLNSEQGSAGRLLHNPELYNHLNQVSANLEGVTKSINQGNGTLGKLTKDTELYDKLNSTVDQLHQIVANLNGGKGSAGKLLTDETLYNNLNSAVANANTLLEGINKGQGAIGKLAKDPEFAKKLDSTVTSLNGILSGINDGKGTLGQLAQNRAVYDSLNATLDESHKLVKAIRENPKQYLVIHLKVF